MQSMQWGMNPFQVAQKTFIVNGGQLSYEDRHRCNDRTR
jgi:hypothetical protein